MVNLLSAINSSWLSLSLGRASARTVSRGNLRSRSSNSHATSSSLSCSTLIWLWQMHSEGSSLRRYPLWLSILLRSRKTLGRFTMSLLRIVSALFHSCRRVSTIMSSVISAPSVRGSDSSAHIVRYTSSYKLFAEIRTKWK